MNNDSPGDGAQDDRAREDPAESRMTSSGWRILPRWWWILAALLMSATFAVRLLDQATGRLLLAAAIMISLFIACLRCLWRPAASFGARIAPVAVFTLIIATFFASVRFDEMDGNMMPRRVSLRWQPAPDERIAKLPENKPAGGVDLSQTTPDDYPQFLGLHRNGSVDVKLAADWSKNAPELLWKKTEFGAGHSGFAAVNGFAVTLEQRGPEEIVSCYEIATGDLAWSHAIVARHETVPGGVGPRSTPMIHNGRVYTLGATGVLQCLSGTTGDVLWAKNLLEEIETTPQAEFHTIQWGRAASPIIDQGRLIVPLGLKADPTAGGKRSDVDCARCRLGRRNLAQRIFPNQLRFARRFDNRRSAANPASL